MSDRTCDDGQICDQTAPGGMVCLDANGDVDGDGIPNGKDFCEHMAGGDHDEDGDGIGDECDPCPIAKTTGTESDGDGVDGVCDPNPTKPGDKIVLFNGFNAALPGSWTATPGWKVQGGEAIMTPTNASTVEQITIPLPVPSSHMTIQVGYRVDSLASIGGNADAGVTAANDLPMGGGAIQCVGSRTGPLDEIVLTTDAGMTTKEQMNLFNPASLYRLGAQLDGTTASCAMISDKETGAVQGPTPGLDMTKIGLYARGATVRVADILVTEKN